MRTTDRRSLHVRSRAMAGAIAIGLLASACGGAPSPPPSAVQTPTPTVAPTPVAHLTEPVEADSVYLALRAAGLKIVPNNASTGGPGHEPVKKINATYAGWPLAIVQFASTGSLLKATGWKPGAKPGTGEAPIGFIGRNILVEWGPTTGASPSQPDERQLAAAEALRYALDPLVSPLAGRTIVPMAGLTPAPGPNVSPGASANASPTP